MPFFGGGLQLYSLSPYLSHALLCVHLVASPLSRPDVALPGAKGGVLVAFCTLRKRSGLLPGGQENPPWGLEVFAGDFLTRVTELRFWTRMGG